MSYPAGLTSFSPMPYGYRRWNNTAWPNSQVDQYNQELKRIEARYLAGYPVDHLINGLYNLAYMFDNNN